MSANSLFEKQIPAAATSNVPHGEVPKSTSEVATSRDGMDNIICTNPSSSKEQIPDAAALSIPAEVVFLTEPETASSEVLERGSVHRENDGISATEIDWWDGILYTMNLESEFQELSLSDLSSVQLLSTLDQDGPLPPDLPVHSPIGGLVREASEARTASVPSVSTGLPLQTAPAVSSRIPLPLYYDPLQIEMERIRKAKDQTFKVYEDMKLQLKSECEKDIEEVVAKIHRKYEVKLQEKEAEFLRQKKQLYVNYSKVLLNKILADAFRSKCMDNRASASAGAQQETSSSFRQQLIPLSSEPMVQQPSPASGLPSTDSATRMQTLSRAVVNAQTMSPPLQPSTLLVSHELAQLPACKLFHLL